MESLTKQRPTNFVVFPDMQHLKAAPCTDFIRQLDRGVLTISHMVGAAPFP